MLTISPAARCIVSTRLRRVASMADVVANLIPFGAFAMVGWLVYTIVNGLRVWHQQRMMSQFQAKLLDRIGSINELGGFLNTEAGSRFLKGLTTINEVAANPSVRILRAVQSGAVLATVGLALFAYGWLTPKLPGDAYNGINAVATILFGLGAGFVVSAAVSYRLSKGLGLLSGDGPSR
jgi:hypothetical protein